MIYDISTYKNMNKENVSLLTDLLNETDNSCEKHEQSGMKRRSNSNGPRARSTPVKNGKDVTCSVMDTENVETVKILSETGNVRGIMANECETTMAELADNTLTEDDMQAVLKDESYDWLPGLFLHKSDQIILQNTKEWLNDRLVYAAMMLLKKQFPSMGGCSDPVMVAALRCKFPDETFVQTIHNGDGHWLTVSNKNCPPGVVLVYDSMHLMPNVNIKKQIAAMSQIQQASVTIKTMNVARQTGSGDCGLFAVAFATSLCIGQDPVNMVYSQQHMRNHLHDCLSSGVLTPFPVVSDRTVRKSVSFQIDEKLFCSCRQIYVRGQRMIECQSCKTWYHQTCEAMSDTEFEDFTANNNKDYICQKCVAIALA